MMTKKTELYGALEAGGTKCICLVGSDPQDIRAVWRTPTTTPAETLARCADFFENIHARTPLRALGIGCFGPLELNPAAPRFGHILSTPKPAWSNTNVLQYFQQRLKIPVIWESDVNAAALGERIWGAGKDLDIFIYLTVGTGIGGGIWQGGTIFRGRSHPEIGHMRVPRHPDDFFRGLCPFHRDCLEGLASGPAIAERWGSPPSELSDREAVWDLEAHYLAHCVANLTFTLAPQKIILGGGVMQQPRMIDKTRHELIRLLNGYAQPAGDLRDYLTLPGLGDQSGILGALALAKGFSA